MRKVIFEILRGKFHVFLPHFVLDSGTVGQFHIAYSAKSCKYLETMALEQGKGKRKGEGTERKRKKDWE